MQILVTGASGHIGANLCRVLLENGHKIRVLKHNETRALEGLNVECVNGDVTQLESLTGIADGIDICYHLAAIISISDGWDSLKKVNVEGTQNIVKECIRQRVKRLVHFSSIHAVMPSYSWETIDEQRPLALEKTCSHYAISKALAEKVIAGANRDGLDTVILRPTAIIGPNDYHSSLLGQALIRLAEHRLPALIDGGYDWVDVRDVAEAAVKAQESAPGGSTFMLSGVWLKFAKLAALIKEVTGVPLPRFTSPGWLAYRGAPFMTALDKLRHREPLFTAMSVKTMTEKYTVNHNLATRELGYRPRPLDQTIRDTLGWYRDYAMLGQTAPVKKAAANV